MLSIYVSVAVSVCSAKVWPRLECGSAWPRCGRDLEYVTWFCQGVSRLEVVLGDVGFDFEVVLGDASFVFFLRLSLVMKVFGLVLEDGRCLV